MRFLAAILCAVSVSAYAKPPVRPPVEDFAARVVFQSGLVVNGVTTAGAGAGERMFLTVQPRARGVEPELAEVVGGKPVPFPDAAWNGWKPGQPSEGRFVGVNSARVGPDGALWVVDRGSVGLGAAQVAGAARLIRIDLATNRVARIYDLKAGVKPASFVDDVRFNGDHAYLTDAGAPALLVLDLRDGAVHRVLEGDRSVTAQRPLVADGAPMVAPDGAPVVIHADQLEVSPNGYWLYFQPCSGPMYRIPTRFLDASKGNDPDLAAHVSLFVETPSTGGTAMAANGVIYLSDVDRQRILAINSTGETATLIADKRFTWVDALWIDGEGRLLLPAAQIDRMGAFRHGVDSVRPQISVYAVEMHAPPLRR